MNEIEVSFWLNNEPYAIRTMNFIPRMDEEVALDKVYIVTHVRHLIQSARHTPKVAIDIAEPVYPNVTKKRKRDKN